jgi:hypothetical protein
MGSIRRRQLAGDDEEEDDDVDGEDVPALDGVLLAAGLPSPPLELDVPALSDLLLLSGLAVAAALFVLSSLLPAPDPGLP